MWSSSRRRGRHVVVTSSPRRRHITSSRRCHVTRALAWLLARLHHDSIASLSGALARMSIVSIERETGKGLYISEMVHVIIEEVDAYEQAGGEVVRAE